MFRKVFAVVAGATVVVSLGAAVAHAADRISSFSIEHGATHVAFSPDGATAYVVSYEEARVDAYAVADGTSVGSVALPGVDQIRVAPSGEVYAHSRDGYVWALSPVLAIDDTVNVTPDPSATGSESFAMDADATHLYTEANGLGIVSIDTATFTVTQTAVPATGDTVFTAVHGDLIYTATTSSYDYTKLRAYDLATGALVATAPNDPALQRAGYNPPVAMGPTGDIWYAYGHTYTEFDAATLKPVRSQLVADVDQGITAFAFGPGGRVYVESRYSSLVIAIDACTVRPDYVSNGDADSIDVAVAPDGTVAVLQYVSIYNTTDDPQLSLFTTPEPGDTSTALAPCPATNVKVKPGNGTATLTFGPAQDGGGGPVTGYLGYAVNPTTGDVAAYQRVETSPIVFDALPAGQYLFGVFAYNDDRDSTFALAGTGPVKVRKAGTAQAIAVTSTPDATVVGSTYHPVATGGGSGNPVQFSIAPGSGCSIDNGLVTFDHVGSCVVQARQAGNATYTAAPKVLQKITVTRGEQIITLDPAAPATAHVGDLAPFAYAGGGSGNAVVVTVVNPAVCRVGTDGISMLAPGTCRVVLEQSGNKDYYTAAKVAFGVKVTAAQP